MAPWEVDSLPEEWIEAVVGLASGLPRIREGQKKVDDAFARFEKQMNYRHGK